MRGRAAAETPCARPLLGKRGREGTICGILGLRRCWGPCLGRLSLIHIWDELRESTWKYPEFKYRKYETGDLRPDGQPGFRTETGRAEIYSMVFHHTSWSGLDPLPSYVEPVESPYSCLLYTSRCV